MGIIQQQTIKGSAYSYIGVIIGFVNLAILSPLIFTLDQIGLTQVIIAVATILAQLGSLGFSNVTNRLFPYFRDTSAGHKGFLSLAFLITAAGFVISVIILSFYLPTFIENNTEKSILLSEFAYYIPILLGFIILLNLLDGYCKVLFNASIGIFLREVLLRLLNLLLIILFYFKMIDFTQYVSLFVLSQAIPALIIIIYLIAKREFKFRGFSKTLDKNMVKQILSLCGYGIIAGLSGIALTNIDKYMVNNYEGLGNAGIYSISVYFATLILIPARSLGKIAVPVIAEAWKRNDIEEISIVYRKSSINQFVIGLLIVVGIIGNLNNIFRLLPDAYRAGEMVIIYFGIANLINVSTGASQYILGTSSLYRYQTYLMLVLIILVISTNILLIPPLGMTGAAIASLISMFVFTSLTLIILKFRFGLWPFSLQHLLAIVVSIAVWAISLLIPEMKLIPDIMVRSGFIAILFLIATVGFRLSDEAVNIWNQFLRKIRNL
ncbi:MAG TPA: oligosaccharide flippase family protein [Bacteroidales bacterium]|nr:oligosaccharide flippase family protein [Bacteroidales bacterium]